MQGQAIGAIAEATSSVTGERQRASAGGVSEAEFQHRLSTGKVGRWLTVLGCPGAAVSAASRWGEPNSLLILVTLGLGLLSVPVILALPRERIVRSRSSELFFAGWSIADIVLIATIAGLDGGSNSAFMLLLVLPVLFASLSYPPRTIAAVAIAAIAAFFIVGFGVGGGFPLSGFALFAMSCVAMLGIWEARNQANRRGVLAATAGAPQRSEESSLLQARQQREVARFGQLAIEGAGIDELCQEACRIVAGVLEIEYGVVLKPMADRDELLLVAGVGIEEELIG